MEELHAFAKKTNEPRIDQVLGLIEAMAGDALAEQLSDAGKRSATVVVVGGCSLYLRGLNDQVRDIDLYCPGWMLASASRLENDPWTVDAFGRPLEIDATDDNALWGEIVIGDIEKEGDSLGRLSLDKMDISVRMLSLETLILLKAHAARDKDLEDVSRLVHFTTPEKIAARLGKVLAYNRDDESFAEYMVSNLIQELSLHYMPDDMERFVVGFLKTAGIKGSLREGLLRMFSMEEAALDEDYADMWSGAKGGSRRDWEEGLNF